ncbi:MAG: hypothetical protein HQL53_13550 [Magnetococcales bacterium]|nr:hypothetical protein [Magnetococcales bacterium]
MADTAPKKSKPRRTFPPCKPCGDDSGFNWACECGFAICHTCMNAQLEKLKCNGRSWVCPECGRPHIGANR